MAYRNSPGGPLAVTQFEKDANRRRIGGKPLRATHIRCSPGPCRSRLSAGDPRASHSYLSTVPSGVAPAQCDCPSANYLLGSEWGGRES